MTHEIHRNLHHSLELQMIHKYEEEGLFIFSLCLWLSCWCWWHKVQLSTFCQCTVWARWWWWRCKQWAGSSDVIVILHQQQTSWINNWSPRYQHSTLLFISSSLSSTSLSQYRPLFSSVSLKVNKIISIPILYYVKCPFKSNQQSIIIIILPTYLVSQKTFWENLYFIFNFSLFQEDTRPEGSMESVEGTRSSSLFSGAIVKVDR